MRADGRAQEAQYTYYPCTSFHERCGNAYICEERLADLPFVTTGERILELVKRAGILYKNVADVA
jgi:hypothetical protein